MALIESVPSVSAQVADGVLPRRFPQDDEDHEDDDLLHVAAGDTAPSAALADFWIPKAVIEQTQPVTHIDLLALRNPRSAHPSASSQAPLPQVLLVAVQASGDVQLFSLSGELFGIFPLGHKSAVTHLSVAAMQDEYIIATCDDGGILRIHRAIVRHRRGVYEPRSRVVVPAEEKYSQYFFSSVNLTLTFQVGMRVPLTSNALNSTNCSASSLHSDPKAIAEAPRVTAIALASFQGMKFSLQAILLGG